MQNEIFFLVLLCVASSNAESLGTIVTCSIDSFCSLADGSIQTPANNSEIRTSCTYSNQNKSALACSTISFYVLVASNQRVQFFPTANLYADNPQVCTTPTAFGSRFCGVGSIQSLTDSNGDSFQAIPYAVLPSPNIPKTQYGIDSTTAVCFRVGENQRCIKIFINVAPSAPLESTTKGFTFSVYVGYELTMKLTSSQIVDTDQVVIGLSADMSPELPGAEWSGETFCLNPFQGLCPFSGTDNWERILVYKPRIEENGNVYTVLFQASSVGFPLFPAGLIKLSDQLQLIVAFL